MALSLPTQQKRKKKSPESADDVEAHSRIIRDTQTELLARLLATERVYLEYNPSAHTAWFDTKNRVLTLPVWVDITRDLRDLLIVHEVGHALDTPSQGWLAAPEEIARKVYGKKKAVGIIQQYLNVVEDVRIDKRQKRRYPGSRQNYLNGYKEIHDRDFFKLRGKDVTKMPFIDRLNIYYKGGNLLLNIPFTAEEQVFVDRAIQTETWAEVVQLTEDVFLFAKEKSQLPDNHPRPKGDGDGTGSPGDEDEDGSTTGEEESDEGEGNGYDPRPNTGGQVSNGPRGGQGSGDFVPASSETLEAYEEALKQSVTKSKERWLYLTTPTYSYPDVVDDFKKVVPEMAKSLLKMSDTTRSAVYNALQEWKDEENKTISYLVKEFECRKAADVLARTRLSKTGIIDTNRLHAYKHTEDIFRRHAIVEDGKNHGFVMVIDWSGSMRDVLEDTLKQVFTLALFCRRVNIPFEVFFFRDIENLELESYNKKKKQTSLTRYDHEGYTDDTAFCDIKLNADKKNPMYMSDMKLRNCLSSRMDLATFNLAMFNLLAYARGLSSDGKDGLTGTPLNQCIYALDRVINKFQKETGVQIVSTIILTDGESSDVLAYRNQADNKILSIRNNERVILTDDVTRKSYDFNNAHDYRCLRTVIMLEIMKSRTDCNVIGFHLCSENQIDSAFDQTNHQMDENLRQQFSDKKWLGVKDAGYDLKFMINSERLSTLSSGLNITKKGSEDLKAREFTEFTRSKAVNRVMLSQFIDIITHKAKRVDKNKKLRYNR